MVKDIYRLTKINTDFRRDFGLCDQIRRSAVSIPSNIAEGYERDSKAEFIRFLRIAKASCAETRTQLYIAFDLGYMTKLEYEGISDRSLKISGMIMKLIYSLQRT